MPFFLSQKSVIGQKKIHNFQWPLETASNIWLQKSFCADRWMSFPHLSTFATPTSSLFLFLFYLIAPASTLFVHPLGRSTFQEANAGNNRWRAVHYVIENVVICILERCVVNEYIHTNTDKYKFRGIIWPSFINMSLQKYFFPIWEHTVPTLKTPTVEWKEHIRLQ